MKLYSEEQVIKLTKAAFTAGKNCNPFIFSQELNSLTPIELPSDEGIKKIMELDDMEFDEFDPYHLAHLEGAKWMRDKIQGGNK